MTATRYIEKFACVETSPLVRLPSYVAAGTASTTDGSSAPTPGNPAGITTGDLKVCAFYSREATDGTVAISGQGWTEFINERTSGGLLAVWWKIHAGDSAPTLTLTNHAAGDTAVAQIAAWRGANSTTPISIEGVVATNGSAQDIGPIVGIQLPPRSVLVVIGGKSDDWTSVATLSQTGMTFAEIGEPDDTAGTDAGMVWNYATANDLKAEIEVSAKTFAVTGGASAVGKGVMFSIMPDCPSYTFPLNRYEWEETQGLRTPRQYLSGAHYALDMLGNESGLKALRNERLRFMLTGTVSANDTAFDTMKKVLHGAGRGKLWLLDDAGVRRWTWGRLQELPSVEVSYRSPVLQPAIVGIVADDDFYAETATESEASATGTVTITNPGNERVYNAVFTLRGTATNPVITNTTNGYVLSTTRDIASDLQRIRFDAGRDEVKYASDGSSYADDYSNFVRTAGQVQLMVLEPGDNLFTFSGISSATLAWRFFGAYR